jgi:hypothetical protein
VSDVQRADRLVARRLALGFFLFYALFTHGHFSGTDELTVFESTQSLAEQGDLVVSPAPCAHPGRGGRLHGCFAAGQSFLALPFYVTGKLARTLLPGVWERRLGGPTMRSGRWSGRSVEIFAVTLYAPVVSGLLVGLFFLFQRRLGISLRVALLTAALVGVCSYVATQSVYFLRHTTEALVVLGALYALLGFRQEGRLGMLAAGSLLASVTLLVRVPMAVAGLGLGVHLATSLWERWRVQRNREWLGRSALAVLGPAACVAAVHVAINTWKWSHWMRSPMLAQSEDRFTAPPLEGLVGLLTSPGGSVFLYTPLLLLLPWTFRSFWRLHRLEAVTIIVISLSILAISSPFYTWHGLWSAPGSRYMFVAVVLLLVPLGTWLEHPLRRTGRVALWVLAGAGALVQFTWLLVSLPAVSWAMGYPKDDPRMLFLFEPEQSPLLGGLRLLWSGPWDIWLWWLWRGWPGESGSPAAVVTILVGWTFAFSLALFWLRGAVLAHPALVPRPTSTQAPVS